MNITCDKCGKKYVIADEKLAGKASAKIRCKQCQNLITVQVASAPVAAAAPEPAFVGNAGGGVIPQAPMPAASGWEEESTRAMPALDMSATWYAMINGAQQGPFDLSTLKRRVDAGEISLRTYLWKPSMGDWKRASDVPEVSMVFAGVSMSAVAPVRQAPTPAPQPTNDAATTNHHAYEPSQPKRNGTSGVFAEAPVSAEPTPAPVAQRADPAALNDLFNDVGQDLGPADQEPAAEQQEQVKSGEDPFAALSKNDGLEAPPPGEATKFFIAQAGVNKRNPPWKIALFAISIVAIPMAVLYLLSSLNVIKPVTRIAADGTVVQESFFSPGGAAAIFEQLSGEGKRKAEEAAAKKAEAAKKAAALAAANTPKVDVKKPEVVADVGTKPPNTGASDLQDLLNDGPGIGSKIPKVRVEDRTNTQAVNTSGLSQESAGKIVSQNMKGFESCIDAALRRNPNLAVGNIILKVTVGGSGAVKSAVVEPKKHENADWAQCMGNVAKRITFPSSDGETDLELPFKVGVAI